MSLYPPSARVQRLYGIGTHHTTCSFRIDLLVICYLYHQQDQVTIRSHCRSHSLPYWWCPCSSIRSKSHGQRSSWLFLHRLRLRCVSVTDFDPFSMLDDLGLILDVIPFPNVSLQPSVYAWAAINQAGKTKQRVTTAIMFVASCVGNVSHTFFFFFFSLCLRGFRKNADCISASLLTTRSEDHSSTELKTSLITTLVSKSISVAGPSSS